MTQTNGSTRRHLHCVKNKAVQLAKQLENAMIMCAENEDRTREGCPMCLLLPAS